ncbi:MAG: chorismate synthase, partial [Flavobacteriales bacterium]
MSSNGFGTVFRLTSFGESHGAAMGGILEGCPPGLHLDLAAVQDELNRRKPGQSDLTSPRKERDQVEFLSGMLNDVTLGTPIGFLVRNEDQHSKDYDALRDVYRPGHADEAWQLKFGIRDHRGGGRSSARETVARVVAGAIARQMLLAHGVVIRAYVSQIHDASVKGEWNSLDLNLVYRSDVRCPDEASAQRMRDAILSAKANHDSVGGVVTCVCEGLPVGLGEPVFDKLPALLAHGMMSLPAAKGFEVHEGFGVAGMYGSALNPIQHGAVGGISTGHPLVFRVAFKPASSIGRSQEMKQADGSRVQQAI